MKKILLFGFFTFSLTCGTMAQTVLQDDFSGSTLNPSLWQTSAPFSDSSITESGGFAVFQNRGRIITANAMPTAIDISGSFEFTGNIHDNFEIETRTDGITSNPYGFFDHGIDFGFTIQNDFGETANNIFISDYDYPSSTSDLTRATYSLSLDTFYNFRITDDGNNIALYIGNLTTPLLTAVDSSVYGNQVALYNREGSGGGSTISAGSVVQLDSLTIQAVPEPSTAWFALGGMGLLLARRMIKIRTKI